MKRLTVSLLMVAIAIFGSHSVTALESPLTIVQNTTDKVIERVVTDRDVLRNEPSKMYNLVSELIFPHFDLPIMAQLVIREHWKAANDETRAAFVEQFRQLLVKTYSIALLEFSGDRKSTRLNSSHDQISYAVFCLKKKKEDTPSRTPRTINMHKTITT